MYKRTLIILLLAVAMGTSAQDTIHLTLDSCLRYAYRHNLTVRTATLNSEAAEVNLTGAKLRFLPSISASASQGWGWDSGTGSSSNTQYGLNGSLTLFSGLSNLRTLQQSRVSAEQSNLKVRQTENTVGVQIIQAYLTILMNEERLSYQQEVLETSHQQQLEGEVKYRVGRILESDYQLLAANYTLAQSEIDNTRLTISDNIHALNDLLCISTDTLVATMPLEDTMRAADRTLPNYDSVIAQARRTMPEWAINDMDVTLAEYNVELAKSAYMPSVSLNAGYGGGWMPAVTTGNGSFADNSSVTLGVSVPIVNRGSSYTQLKQCKIALQQTELQHEQNIINIYSQIDDIYLAIQQALNRYRASEALAEAYRSSYEVYVTKYGEGAITTVEMLQQQDRYLSALNDYLQNKYTYILAEKQLDIYTGKEIKL